jgi:cytochrome b561
VALRSTDHTWGSVTRALHWLIALAVVGLHKSMGLTVLVLVVLRIAWRIGEAVRPAHPPDMPAWQARASTAVHLGLYTVMLGMPLSGWWFNSAANFPLRWFGLFKVPALAGADAGAKALAGAIHFYGAWLLALLFVLHVAGALKHHFVDRDAVLRRMLTGGARAAPPPAANTTAAAAPAPPTDQGPA